MVKSAAHYLKTGALKSVTKIHIKESLNLVIFYVAALIGKLLFFTIPIVWTAEKNVSKAVLENKTYKGECLFDKQSDDKRYFKMMVFLSMKHLTIIASILLLAGLMYGLVNLSYRLDIMLEFRRYVFIPIAAYIGLFALLLMMYKFITTFVPLSHVLLTEEQTLIEAYQLSKKLIEKGRIKLFIIYVAHLLVSMILIAFALLIGYLLYDKLIPNMYPAIMVLVVVVLLFILPRVRLSLIITVQALMIDLAVEISYENLFTEEKVNITQTKVSKEALLTNLFDELIIEETVYNSEETTKEKESLDEIEEEVN